MRNAFQPSIDRFLKIYSQPMEGDVLGTLRQCSLLADLAESDLRALLPGCLRMRLRANEILFHAGSPGGSLFIIERGELQIEIIRYHADGSDEVVNLAKRGPGDVIGEMSLFDNEPRTATVRASQDTQLVQVDGRYFTHYLERNGKVAIALLKTLVRKLREAQEHQVSRETAPLGLRLASRLIGMAPDGAKGSVVIADAPTQKNLARELGCSREAISRAAAALGDGLITFARGRIFIREIGELRRLTKK